MRSEGGLRRICSEISLRQNLGSVSYPRPSTMQPRIQEAAGVFNNQKQK